MVRALKGLAPRLVEPGGGGCNPWSAARCWAGVRAELAGHELPDRLPEAAEAVLHGLAGKGVERGRPVAEAMFTTRADLAREGPVHPERLGRLRARAGR